MFTKKILILFVFVISFSCMTLSDPFFNVSYAASEDEEIEPEGDGAGMWSPMMNAAQLDDWNTVLQIASRERPWSELEPDMTVLHHAAMRADNSIVMALLKYGADPSVRDNYGNTPYDYALKNKKLSSKTINLLKKGLKKGLK